MPRMNRTEAIELIESVCSGEFEDAGLEVKRAQRGLPQRLYEALSAFANHADRQKSDLEYLRKNGRITSAEHMILTGVSERTAQRDLGQMESLGLIRRSGKARDAHYMLAEQT